MQGDDLYMLPAGGELRLHDGEGDYVVQGLGYEVRGEFYTIVIKSIY